MFHLKPSGLRVTLAALALLAASVLPAGAYTIFENLPTNLSGGDPLTESHHGVGGPILADDFVPAAGGIITRVEWWGSRALDDRWELVFHSNNAALSQPNVDNDFSGGLIKYGEDGSVRATGVADVPGHLDIFHYTVDLPGPLFLGVNAGTPYWFTVANFVGDWHWADALTGPTVGSEYFNGHRSTGALPDPGACADGGPHCGPWTDVHSDFAFRINAVAEPEGFALVGLGLALLAVMRRKQGATST